MFGNKFRLTRAFGGRARSVAQTPAKVDRQASPMPQSPPRIRPTEPIGDRVSGLDDAIGALRPYMREEFIYSAALVNPLLVVWGAARAVEADVASPVEGLLTDLMHRTTVTTEEILAAMDEVRARALQELVLEGCALSS